MHYCWIKQLTITLGNRMAAEFIPASGVSMEELADAAQLSSLADETPEGRSIVVFAKQQYNLRERDIASLDAEFVPFTAYTRMSGVNFQGHQIRKGAMDAVRKFIDEQGSVIPEQVRLSCEGIAKDGGTPSWWRMAPGRLA